MEAKIGTGVNYFAEVSDKGINYKKCVIERIYTVANGFAGIFQG